MRQCAIGLLVLLATGLAVPSWADETTAPAIERDQSATDEIPATDAQSNGIGAPGDRAVVDLKTRAQTVAIVSAFGDAVGYQAINVALWDNGYSQTIQLDGADLDGAVVRSAIHTLTQDVPGFGLVQVDVPHATLVAHANSIRLGDGPLDMVRDDLKAWRDSHPVDLVIVLLPAMGQISKHDDFPRAFFGFGVSGRQTVLFMRAVVLDGRSGAILNDLKARAVGRLGGVYPEAAFSHPTPQHKEMLAAEMRNILVTTVPGLLRNVGL